MVQELRPPTMQNQKLGFAIFVLLFGGGIAAMLLAGRGLGVQAPAVRSALFEPYFAKIAGGDIEAAWTRHTTASFRATHPLEAVRGAYAERTARHGAITGTRCPRIQGERRIGRDVLIAATCYVRFRDGWEARVGFGVMQAGGAYLIDTANESGAGNFETRGNW